MGVTIFDQKKLINKKIVVHLVKRILKEEKYKLNNLNIIITGNKHLLSLNKKFFNKKRSTNVISFKMEEVSEIYVSQNKAENIKELYYFIIHGLLHIVGYNHRNKKEEQLMEERCIKYLEYTGKCPILE